MKTTKLSLIISFVALFGFTLQAQKKSMESEKCVSQGKFIIDVYYGYPYIMGNLIKEANANSNANATANGYYPTDDKIINYNHVGGKFEYMINDMIGMGVDYTYAKVVDNYSRSYYTSVNGTSVLKVGRFTESLVKQRFLGRVNIHFATSRELDPYATAGIGYKQTIFKTNDPNDLNYTISTFNAFPVAFRMGAGLRWFFMDNIGVSVEAGIGGPAIQGGLSAKF